MVQLITIFITFFTLFAASVQGAEKPYKRAGVVKSYRTCMKEKNFTQARKVLDDAMRQYPEAASDAQLYRYKLDAINELIGVENRKIYLNSKPDTVCFFNYIYDLYTTGLRCDSVEQQALDARRAEGKKAEPKLRGGVGQTLLLYRKNLFNAGKYHYTKKSYADAFRFFDMYVQTKTSDVFYDSKGNSTLTDPDDLVDASVLSTLSAYGSSNYSGVVTYLAESLKDDGLRPHLLEIGAKTSAELTDTTQMVQFLEQGFEAYPDVEYFYVTLVKYYNTHRQYEEALQKARHMTSLYPLQRDYWYVAGTELALLDRNDEALQSFRQCVEIKADDAQAWASIGSIYLHQAHVAYENFNLSKNDPAYNKQKNAITQLYRDAAEAFEQSRKFDEVNTSLWLEGLRESYFKLNRGKSLRGLEKYK